MKKMFWMSISREALFSDACLVLIVAGLVCATVRWFHMCSPYSDNEKVFYPARRQMSLFFALPVLLVPYVLMPSGPAVMTYAVSVWIFTYPSQCRFYIGFISDGNLTASSCGKR